MRTLMQRPLLPPHSVNMLKAAHDRAPALRSHARAPHCPLPTPRTRTPTHTSTHTHTHALRPSELLAELDDDMLEGLVAQYHFGGGPADGAAGAAGAGGEGHDGAGPARRLSKKEVRVAWRGVCAGACACVCVRVL
jgi:hypothetical protein